MGVGFPPSSHSKPLFDYYYFIFFPKFDINKTHLFSVHSGSEDGALTPVDKTQQQKKPCGRGDKKN